MKKILSIILVLCALQSKNQAATTKSQTQLDDEVRRMGTVRREEERRRLIRLRELDRQKEEAARINARNALIAAIRKETTEREQERISDLVARETARRSECKSRTEARETELGSIRRARGY